MKMENNKWIYFGVFLDENSKNELVNITNKLFKKFNLENWKIFCHHMTIAFNNKTNDALELFEQYKNDFGTEYELIATHVGISDDAMAVKVSFNYPIANKIPHITLATPQNGKPVNSNHITDWKKLSKPIKLTGVLNSFNKK
jgi:2'-5' RNA ligase